MFIPYKWKTRSFLKFSMNKECEYESNFTMLMAFSIGQCDKFVIKFAYNSLLLLIVLKFLLIVTSQNVIKVCLFEVLWKWLFLHWLFLMKCNYVKLLDHVVKSFCDTHHCYYSMFFSSFIKKLSFRQF